MAPAGILVRLAPVARLLAAAGMLATTQCQKPDPVGASGSNIVSTKLLVPWGAPCHESWGETLPPVQPKPLSTCGMANVPPLRSVVISMKPGVVGTTTSLVGRNWANAGAAPIANAD